MRRQTRRLAAGGTAALRQWRMAATSEVGNGSAALCADAHTCVLALAQTRSSECERSTAKEILRGTQ